MKKIDMDKEKIDLVYTWVDSSDENWQKKKAEFEKANGLKPDKLVSRYRDNDELKYSLRSVEKYVPWINHIYIITDNQIPKWLNTNNPKITIVDHSEIMPKEALPTFNSMAIEYCMHKIPNLSEYFLYANDDMYFADFVAPDFFYKNDGYPICRFIKAPKNATKPYQSWVKKAQQLIKEKYHKKFTQYSHHCIDAYRKSTVNKCREVFKEEIDNVIHAHFRAYGHCQRVLYMYYACVTNQGHFKLVSRIDPYLPFLKKIINFITKNYQKDTLKFYSSSKTIKQDIKKYKPKLICINDSSKVTEDDIMRAKGFLNDIFPDKSEFEL